MFLCYRHIDRTLSQTALYELQVLVQYVHIPSESRHSKIFPCKSLDLSTYDREQLGCPTRNNNSNLKTNTSATNNYLLHVQI